MVEWLLTGAQLSGSLQSMCEDYLQEHWHGLLTEAKLRSYIQEHGKFSVSSTPLKNIVFCPWWREDREWRSIMSFLNYMGLMVPVRSTFLPMGMLRVPGVVRFPNIINATLISRRLQPCNAWKTTSHNTILVQFNQTQECISCLSVYQLVLFNLPFSCPYLFL